MARRRPRRPRRPRRRIVFALVLLLLGAASGGVAAAMERTDAEPLPLAAPSAVTPVLSARRVPALLAAPVADRRLAAALDGVLAAQDGIACLSVASSSRIVYEREPGTVVVPASVEKLLTATAALELLGPDHVFHTPVVAASGPDADGTIAGDLVLVGAGDPLLSTPDYPLRFRDQPQVSTSLDALAQAVVDAGVRHVTGRVLGDESRYDTDRYPDAWPERYISQDQSGPLSALSVNDGWATYPPDPDSHTPDETPADQPAATAAQRFLELLQAHGITVDGGAAAGAAPAGAVEVAGVDSAPLTEVVREMLQQSDNQTAELLLKELAVATGRPGTTVDGAAAVGDQLAVDGLPVPVVVDGSGLATGDRVTCALLLAVLDHAGPDSPLAAGLSVAGTNGTLALRFLDSPVKGRLKAKTGTLNAVTALAGYLDTLPGARLAFAFVVNTVGADEVDGVTTAQIDADDLLRQEALANALDSYPEGPALELLSPAPVGGPQPTEPEVPAGG